MSKTLRTVALIASAVALTATGVGAVAGAGLITLSTATAATVASVATAVSAAASIGAALTAKPPGARGSITRTIIQSDAPQPYAMGRTYSGGFVRHQVGYGATLKKVPNPYLGIVTVYSGSGPIEEIESLQVDYQAVTFTGGAAGGYFSTFMYADTQLGATPESTALVPNFSGMPGWDSSSKLSGYAAVLWNLKFDKEAKRFASGVPVLGAIVKGVKVYDPTLDSTYPGGSGSHRITDESTWTYSTNPALHALVYAYGRKQNGLPSFGIGLSTEALDLAAFVAWRNVCEDNGWEISGLIYEPADKWQNLKDIYQAGGATPAFSGGKLTVVYQAPRVALDTITVDDIVGACRIPATRSYGDRINTLVPKYRSEDHNWQYVNSQAVTDAAYVALDGEVKEEERQYNLVADKDHAAQLCAYELAQRREIEPIELLCSMRLRLYGPGDCLTVDLPRQGLSARKCVVVSRTVDPVARTVQMVLVTETDAKHAYALGQTGTAPPTPALFDTEDADGVASGNRQEFTFDQVMINQSYTVGFSADPITAEDVGTDCTITIPTHTRIYPDKEVSVTGDELTGIGFDTTFGLYYDDPSRSGGAVVYALTTIFADAYNSPTHPDRHFMGIITTPADGAPPSEGGGSGPGGGPLP